MRLNAPLRLMIRPILAFVLALGLPLQAGANPDFWIFEFPKADFSRSTIDLIEITTVLQRDQIPAVHDVQYLAVADEQRLDAREPVLTLELDGAAPRAYPIRYLMYHEIANDEVAGIPVAVTYCPLCNSGMVFDRRVGGQTLSFGVSGKLRHSDMVMYDLETHSFWQQALGAGIVGAYAGAQLIQLPAWMESWAEFHDRNPEGLVMDAPRAITAYGRNPYVGYDSRDRPYAQFYSGEEPPHDIPALMRVIRVGERAWPLSRLQEREALTEAGVRITWRAGQASAMDTGRIASGRDVGTIRVRDAETGADLPHDIPFAFAFHALHPNGIWMVEGATAN